MNGNEMISRAGRRLAQFLWDPDSRNEDDSPIWCLGQRYDSQPLPPKPDSTTDTSASRSESTHSNVDSGISSTSVDSKPQDRHKLSIEGDESFEQVEAQDEGLDNGWPAAFLDDVESRLWLTYRSDFEEIKRSTDPQAISNMTFTQRLKAVAQPGGFKSDSGWGCMIRSGQSLLANTLLMVELGRDWRKGQNPEAEANLLSLFADDPQAPFSIHRFVEHGASACGKPPGEWFGPSATARCIQALTSSHTNNPSGLRIYVRPDDSDIYEDAFLATAKDSSTGVFHPTLVLLGTRLGIRGVTPAYWASLAATLALPQSVGIAGGRTGSAHYFIGVQGANYFFLDPHFTRPKLPINPSAEDVAACHTRRIRSLHVTKMDPSMLLGFLIRSEDDWKEWRAAVSQKPQVGAEGGKSSLVVHVYDFEPKYAPGSGEEGERASAVDEVQSCDEDMESGEDGDTVVC